MKVVEMFDKKNKEVHIYTIMKDAQTNKLKLINLTSKTILVPSFEHRKDAYNFLSEQPDWVVSKEFDL